MAWIDALTCWNPKGGANTIDYLMGSPSLITEIREFTISGRHIGLAVDHAYLCVDVAYAYKKVVYAKNETMFAKYQFFEETIDLFRCGHTTVC